MSKKQRLISLLMAIVMLLSSIIVTGVIIPTVLAGTGEYAPTDDALHFYIRHWHSFIDDEALYQGDSNDGDKDRYFVLVEGYIEPKKDENGEIDCYEFYIVNQDPNAGNSSDNPKYFKYGDGVGDNELDFTQSPYVENLDETTGTITLSKRPLMDGDDALEKYAGLSISTGRRAITENDDGTIEITYSKYIHLVKGHAFYIPWQMIVDGSSSTTVDGDAKKLEDLFSDEIDTASVYTYINDAADGSYSAGEIVMSATDNTQACVSKDDLPEGVNEEDVQLRKFYSTVEGLHTDNTVTALDDGRTFVSNLEAWYVEGHAPEVAMVLDASGSMAFPVDTPSPIHLDETEIANLGITKLTSANDPNSGDDGWNNYFLDDETLAKLLNPRNTDNSMVGVSGYSYFAYSSGTGYVPLAYWEGVVTQKADTEFDFQISEDDVKRGWPNELHGDLKLGSTGFIASGTGSSANGIVLDAMPTGKNFTVSFNLITTTSGDPSAENRKIAELLYIGPMSGSTADGDYYRLIRDQTGNSSRLRGNQSPDRTGWVTDINNVFNKSATQRVTLVFNEGTVTSYIDGSVGTGGNNGVNNVNEICELSDDQIYIILNGIKDSYDGAQIVIDELYVFDTALSETQVKNITKLGKSDGRIGWYEFKNDSGNRPYPGDSTSRTWLMNSDVDNHGGYASKLAGKLNITNNTDIASAPTIATRGDGRTLASINVRSISSYGNWPSSAELSHTQAGWYFVTHAGLFDTHYNAIGTGKRMYGISGKFNAATFYDKITEKRNKLSDDTGFSYRSTQDEPIRFYVDEDGYLRCFYLNASTYSNANNAICSYVYNLADSQYVRTEVLRRAAGMFVTDLNAQSPSANVSAVRFSTSYIKFGYYDSQNNLVFKENGKWVQDNGNNAIGSVSDFTDELPMLLLQDWTNNTIESAAMLSMNYGQDSINDGHTNHEIGGARAYTYSTAHHLKQYNYGLTGSTSTWSGIQSYINTLEEYTDQDSPKYLIVFTDGMDTCIGNTNKVYIRLGKDAEVETVEAGKAAETLTNYLKNEGYTIFTVLLDGDDMPEDSQDFKEAVKFLTKLSGPGKREDESDAEYQDRVAKDEGNYFFSLNFGVDDRKNELAQAHEEFTEKYGDNVKYSQLNDEEKAIIDAEFNASYTATDILTEIFTEEILGAMTSALDGYTVKSYIDPRFDLQASDGTVWHLNADGKIVVGDGSGKNGKITVNSTSLNKFKLTGDMNANAKEPYLRYDAKEDMYYFEWVNQTIPTSSVGADRLAIWNALYTLKAKDDFIGGNTILTNGNKASMNWVYHPGDLPLDNAAGVADSPSAADTEPFGYDANSGTSDSKKELDNNGIVSDGYPSKGFPRTTVNVQLLPIETIPLSKNIYMGEVISPMELLLDIENRYFTESYYLDYLKRYAYQRYVKESDQELKKELDMPLLDLLTEWLEIDDDSITLKEFSIPYSYLPNVEYNSETGKVVLNEDGTAKTIYNNTGLELHEQDIVGILTYRWEQLDPDPDQIAIPIKDAVKDNTERAMYSLTAEFTPLQVGDDLDTLNAAVETTGETTADDLPIASAVEVDGGDDIPTRVRDGIFTNYIPIRGTKTQFDESYLFDRESYINDRLVIETHETEDENGDTVTKSYYKWNKEYKPTEDGTEQVLDIPLDDPNYPYGKATFLNSGRTLSAFSVYTLDVVSGDIILELKMLIGELEEAAKAVVPETDEDGVEHYKTTFTLEATRSFTDTDFIEKLKAIKKANNEAWEDYGENFKFTFELDYTQDDIDALKASLEEPDADPDGYVKVYAKVISILHGDGETWKSVDLADVGELPIGTYKFTSTGTMLKDENSVLYFSGFQHEADKNQFTNAYPYFSELVLRGLNTTHENPEIKWTEDEVTSKNPEITKDNVKTFVAEAVSDDEGATFYIGTSQKTSPKRGNTLSGEKYYTDYRLGMLFLSTGMVRLTVQERGARSNEGFLYRIKGKTLGGNDVDLIIFVEGGGKTTVELFPGNYTVEEISDWSWKYENEKTEGNANENWVISDNLKNAETTLRFRSYDPDNTDDPFKEHKTVTYYHKPNDKVWLGGEDHKNNLFTFGEEETE